MDLPGKVVNLLNGTCRQMPNLNKKLVDLNEIEKQLFDSIRTLQDAHGKVRAAQREKLRWVNLDRASAFEGRFEREVKRVKESIDNLPKYPVGDKAGDWLEADEIEGNTKRLIKEWRHLLEESSEEVWSMVTTALMTSRLYSDKDKFPESKAIEEMLKKMTARQRQDWGRNPENHDYIIWKDWHDCMERWFTLTVTGWPDKLVVTPEPAVLKLSTSIEGKVSTEFDKLNTGFAKSIREIKSEDLRLNNYVIPPAVRPDLVGNEYNCQTGKLGKRTYSLGRWFIIRGVMEKSNGWRADRPIDLIEDLIPKNKDEADEAHGVYFKSQKGRYARFFRMTTGDKIRRRLNQMGFNAVYELVSLLNEEGEVFYEPLSNHGASEIVKRFGGYISVDFEKSLGEKHFRELRGVLGHYGLSAKAMRLPKGLVELIEEQILTPPQFYAPELWDSGGHHQRMLQRIAPKLEKLLIERKKESYSAEEAAEKEAKDLALQQQMLATAARQSRLGKEVEGFDKEAVEKLRKTLAEFASSMKDAEEEKESK
jgi:hypothetical protein